MTIVLRLLFTGRIARAVLLALLFTGEIRSAGAQSKPSANPESPAVGNNAPSSTIRFSLESYSRLGAYSFVPEQWCDLHLRFENTGESTRNLICTSYFESDPSLQYGRQVWLPPHARMSLSHPALIPRESRDQGKSINIHSLLIERNDGAEVLLKTESEQLRNDRTLMLAQPTRNTGIVYGGAGASEVPRDVMDLVIGCRVIQRLSNKVTILSDDFLPTDENSLRCLDHLVVADNRLNDDYAALSAVRRWLHSGGRLWVMLDRVNSELLERLLGDDFHGYVADRVGLTSLRVDSAPTLKNPDGEPGETLTFDEPVEMARLVVTGMKVWHTVDGWPATLTVPWGEGRLLISTVGPRALIKATPPERLAESDPQLKSDYIPRTPMADLSTTILASREPPLLVAADIESLAREYISYKIPNWTLIAGVMGGFLGLLILAGGLSWRLQRLEHFGWWGALLASSASLVLLMIGQSHRQGVPPTESSVQLAQVVGGTDDVRSRGAAAVYRSEPSQETIESLRGGVVAIDMKGLEGVTRRMITTDLQTFRWEGLPQPSGLHLFLESTSDTTSNRYEVRSTFNEQGLSGRFTGSNGAGADAMLATQFGRIGVKMSSEGALSGGVDEILATDQYMAANFLGAEQERRRRILEKLFESKSWKTVLRQPQLLVWLNDWPRGFTFGEGLIRQQQTLLVLPVEITRPKGGSEMLIPSPLVSFGTRLPPDGSLPTGCWDDGLGTWQERSSPCTTWLSFQIPRSLLPAKVSKVQLDIKASGAIGRLELLGIRDHSAVRLKEVVNPVGMVHIEITDASVLNLSEDGELGLGIAAGDPNRAGGSDPTKMKVGATADYWKIESAGLNVWATTTDGQERD